MCAFNMPRGFPPLSVSEIKCSTRREGEIPLGMLNIMQIAIDAPRRVFPLLTCQMLDTPRRFPPLDVSEIKRSTRREGFPPLGASNAQHTERVFPLSTCQMLNTPRGFPPLECRRVRNQVFDAPRGRNPSRRVEHHAKYLPCVIIKSVSKFKEKK